jgi:hypothetical protein
MHRPYKLLQPLDRQDLDCGGMTPLFLYRERAEKPKNGTYVVNHKCYPCPGRSRAYWRHLRRAEMSEVRTGAFSLQRRVGGVSLISYHFIEKYMA